jgi:site-specific recombinase XerC
MTLSNAPSGEESDRRNSLSGRELQRRIARAGFAIKLGGGAHPLKIRHTSHSATLHLPNRRHFNKVQLGLYRSKFVAAFGCASPF